MVPHLALRLLGLWLGRTDTMAVSPWHLPHIWEVERRMKSQGPKVLFRGTGSQASRPMHAGLPYSVFVSLTQI